MVSKSTIKSDGLVLIAHAANAGSIKYLVFPVLTTSSIYSFIINLLFSWNNFFIVNYIIETN